MTNLHEKMLPTSAGVEPATSWSGGRVVRLEGECICMSICLSVNTYLNFSATLELSSRESLMACQRSSNHVLNQPIKIQIFNALAVVQTNPCERTD